MPCSKSFFVQSLVVKYSNQLMAAMSDEKGATWILQKDFQGFIIQMQSLVSRNGKSKIYIKTETHYLKTNY